ncbi:hypothetical protein GCM10027176_80230 [Actinoallomurus bryophytorum]|uniref:Uncharacterized protein n=1 Tax=Actinoallomurus bryophytorum TaxID=1490222 RepID=A0A543CR58_9ACTN|nr:hypothetical protein [Actinoallomurus bryophytorum]TQL99579.1 hypothetical protein FB559_5273 [Actinoallomurus bryophytorum]
MGRLSMVVFMVVITVAGCGGAGDSNAGGGSPVPSRTPSAAASVTNSATAGALPVAADGTRLSACHTRKCEVLVSPHDEISPPARLGVTTVTVKSITGEGVTYAGSGPGITLSLGGQRRGMTSYMNNLAITTVAVQDGKAVVRFAKR